MALLAALRRHWPFLAIVAAIVLFAGAGVVARGLARVAGLDLLAEAGGPTFLDRDGQVLASPRVRGRSWLSLPDIPAPLRQAVVAVEDSRFYRHPGIDPVGIARAVWVNLRERGPVQGGSTITQQLARTLFLGTEKTLARKLEEAVLALLLELRFSKDEILEMYLNRVFFGEGTYGADAAAHTYFGKDASRLTLAEAALLAGLIRAPALYSPRRYPDAARARRNFVLARMEELELVDPAAAAAAREEPLTVAHRPGGPAPYFLDHAAEQLEETLGPALAFHGGLVVQTTLDRRLQEAAAAALGSRQGALVALDPRNGHILAMVGGRSYGESQWNRAVRAVRQPGSAFKPILYAAALERGWQVNSLVEDFPRAIAGYEPRNWDDTYRGRVTAKHALAHSLNSGTAWLLHQIGVDAGLEMARRLGISTLTPEDRNLALALGGLTRGVTPLELAAAYGAFASGGVLYPPRTLLRVTGPDGRAWLEPRPAGRQVLSPQVAYLITDMLVKALREGTGVPAQIGRPAAGKTGTTNARVDAWFAGYTPDLVAVVYVGNDDRTPLPGGGASLAAPVWTRFMREALAGRPPRPFPVPPGVVTGVPVDVTTGLLAGPGCRQVERSAFVAGTEPARLAPCARGAEGPSPDRGRGGLLLPWFSP